MKLQGNGEATKSEIKVSKSRNRKGGWSQGIIKSSAKKRKADSESLLNDSSITTPNKSQVNGINDDVQQASGSEAPPVLTEDPTPDDSQASDAFDSQPEIDSGAAPPLIISKNAVVVNVEKLEALLNAVVAKTENWSLEKLLRLYSKLSKLIDRYLKLWDRQPMVEVCMQHQSSLLNAFIHIYTFSFIGN